MADGLDPSAHRLDIPCSRHDPKILRLDDAKVVGDLIAEDGPIAGDFFAQEPSVASAKEPIVRVLKSRWCDCPITAVSAGGVAASGKTVLGTCRRSAEKGEQKQDA